jgi:hypothetical protein
MEDTVKTNKIVGCSLLLFLAFLIWAPTCWAKSKGYIYVVGYSFAEKKAYFSNIIVQKVRNVPYDEEEYATEVGLLQKIEARFQELLVSDMQLTTSQYTVAARGAYKNEAIAKAKIDTEMRQYVKRGYTAKVLKDFIYSD